MSDPPKKSPSVLRFEINPYGDMYVVLRTTDVHATFLVSSHQLCDASTVFAAMLGPKSSFSEAHKLRQRKYSTSKAAGDELYQLKVSDHDPTALAVVLFAMHAQSNRMPENVAFGELLEIAYICDYYDCAGTLMPWYKKWLENLRQDVLIPGNEDYLFISWVFGDQSIFGPLTMRLLRMCAMEGGKFVVVVNNEPREVMELDHHTPEGIQSAIAERRDHVCSQISRACRKLLDRFETDTKTKCLSNLKSCDYFLLGGLRQGLREAGFLSSSFEEDNSHLSLETLAEKSKKAVEQIRDMQLAEVTYNGSRHISCATSAGFDAALADINNALALIKELELNMFKTSPVKHITFSWRNILLHGNKSTDPREEGKGSGDSEKEEENISVPT